MPNPLVDYESSSESDKDQTELQQQQAAKRRKRDPDATYLPNAKQPPCTGAALPRLPDSFYSLYATNVRRSNADDPALHGGRKRQIAHKEGNWPTHIYLEWLPAEPHERYLSDIIQHAQRGLEKAKPETSSRGDGNVGLIHSLLRSDLHVQLPLHISLSVPLVLETTQKDRFELAVRTSVSEHGARSHHVRVRGVEWVSNLDSTRWFLVLQLTRPATDDLQKLLDACNSCARKFQLPGLYAAKSATGNGSRHGETDDRFHVSIAWTLQQPHEAEESLDVRLESLPSVVQLKREEIAFDTVKLKMGNAVHDIFLPPAAANAEDQGSGNGISGVK